MRLTDCPPASYFEPRPYQIPICPMCGEETDELVLDKDGDVCGCRECIQIVTAWGWAAAHG